MIRPFDIGVIALCALIGAGTAVAQEPKTRPATAEEQKASLDCHRSLKDKLIQAGVLSPYKEKEILVRAILGYGVYEGIEIVEVWDGTLSTSYERRLRSPVGMYDYGWIGPENAKNEFKCRLTRERVTELFNLCFTAIEGQTPIEHGGLLEWSYTKLFGKTGEPLKIPVDEAILGSWPRVYEGFQFYDDWTQIRLWASNGEIGSYTKHCYSQVPPTIEVRLNADEALTAGKKACQDEIKKRAAFDPEQKIRLNDDGDGGGKLFASKTEYEEAIASKREYLKEQAASFALFLDVEPVVQEPPKLLIVNPNLCYTEKYKGWSDRSEPETRLAWVVKLQYAAKADGKGEEREHAPTLDMEIWVDSADGKVLGGQLPY